MAKDKKKSKTPSTATKTENASRAEPKKPSVGPVKFIQQVRSEVEKVTWTSRQETIISTMMVLFMVVVMSLFFFFVDWFARSVIQFILSLG